MKKMSIQGRGNNTLASAHSQSKVKPHWNRSSNSGSRLKAQYQFGSLDVRLGCAGWTVMENLRDHLEFGNMEHQTIASTALTTLIR